MLFRSRVLLISLLYLVYAGAALVALSVVAANPNEESVTAAVIIAIVTSGMHVLTSFLGAALPSGRVAWQVEPLLFILISDAMQTSALAAVVTAASLSADVAHTPASVCIASNALIAAAQVFCLYKSSQLLDPNLFDQETGEKQDADGVF